MDTQAMDSLRADAKRGNAAAQALLVNYWLANAQPAAIDDWLENLRGSGRAVDADFLEAELACFHGRQPPRPWLDLLNDCVRAGHAEARFVAAVYCAWSGGNTNGELKGRDLQWQPPSWETVADGDGVKLEKSATFLPRIVVGFVRSNVGKLLRPASVVDPDSGQAVAHPVRINRTAQWFPELLGWTGKLLETRLAEAGGYDVAHGEVLSLLHYQVGDRYKAHFDCIGNDHASSAAGREQGGQRTTTVLLAMGDDDFSGGETRFPRLKAKVRAATGELIRFNNADVDGNALPASLHEGLPIESGQKWLLSKWVRQLPTPYGRELALAPLTVNSPAESV